jgi:hypothetical protein
MTRGEKIELLVGKSESMLNQTEQFHQNARNLRWNMLIKNAKYYAFLAILFVVGLLTYVANQS